MAREIKVTAADLANYKIGAAGYMPANIREAALAALRRELGVGGPAKKVVTESDSEIDLRLAGKFATLRTMTEASLKGDIHSLVVSGPPGLGKSFEVDRLFAAAEADKKSGRKVVDVHGYVRPTGLYKMLYENSKPNCTIKFDDSDSILKDHVSLNILKAALDMKARRRISWLAETKMKDEEGDKVPRHFDFEGNIIFITNIDFAAAVASGSELSEHLDALMSRSHYLDLDIKTVKDRIVRVRQVVQKEKMLLNDGFSDKQAAEILKYVEDHADRLREVSCRTVAKIAGLSRANSEWKMLAQATCMRERVVLG